jgi:hypothetical protein
VRVILFPRGGEIVRAAPPGTGMRELIDNEIKPYITAFFS